MGQGIIQSMIGIDLGTTNSLVAILRDGHPMTLLNELGEDLVPSAVAVAKDGGLLVGRAAKDRLVTAPDAGRAFFKRDMGTPAVYPFGGRTWTPVECSAAILRELKRIAELRLETAVDKAVITVPAYFHDLQRQATLEAARIAGLEVERLVNEPTAAALAYGFRPDADMSTLMIFDLGGGTFDVTLLECFDGVIEVKASAGESRLGGEDYTDHLAEWIIEKVRWRPDGPDRGHWREQVEELKRQLGRAESATIRTGKREIEVTRRDFQEATLE
ncbi:MAG: Hsp70 family protein, partial [Verrucomicrobia bacterium]|nr:Hsp70 family protein [Verrucomicrobiota bacterium]